MKKLKNYRSLIILMCSIILGTILGLIFKSDVVFLKPLGDIFLNMMFTLVVPLIFFTVTSSIASMNNLKRLSKILKTVILVFIVTSLVSAILMFVVLKFVNLDSNIVLEDSVVNVLPFSEQIVKAITVNDFSLLLSKSNILPLIIFSILFGVSLSLVGDKGKVITDKLNILSRVMMKMIKLVMYYAPIGLCAYFAALVGEYGPSITFSYAKSILIYYVVSIVYLLVFYTIYAYIAGKRKGVTKFWDNIIPSLVTSLATQSSLATLPVNMDVSDNMNIPKDVSKVSLSLGSTMHMEGSAMGAILKIMFVFALLGRPFTGIGNILTALVIATLSAVVMAGVPGGGLIGESLIISLYGFPASTFAIISTIGILIDPPATMLNACGDIASTMLTSKFVNSE